jgi:ribosome-binding protein aMBF1 (putative translation factor)
MIEEVVMGFETQVLTAADGSELVVLKRADFETLLEAYEDAEDAAGGMLALKEAEREGTVPEEVLFAVLDEAVTPVLAWRRYRGLSQAELARRAGISQVWLGRIESGEGYGRPKVRAALAAALEAPMWTLDFGVDDQPEAPPVSGQSGQAFPSKSAEIRHWLANGLSRSEISRKMGIRYQHVRNVEVSGAKG